MLPYLLAAVQFPIIGEDFLCFFRLLVDPVDNQLVDITSYQSFNAISSPGDAGQIDAPVFTSTLVGASVLYKFLVQVHYEPQRVSVTCLGSSYLQHTLAASR
jgi:hypothetical protein